MPSVKRSRKLYPNVLKLLGEKECRLAGEGERAFLRMNSNSYLGLSLRPEVMAAEEEAAGGHLNAPINGTVVGIQCREGDEVKRGDIVATVETDKAVMDVEIFRDGFLSGPIAPLDAVVPVTHAIGYLVESRDEVVESESAQPAPSAAAPAAQPPAASPAAATPAAARTTVGGVTTAPRPQGGKASPLARRLAGQAVAAGPDRDW